MVVVFHVAVVIVVDGHSALLGHVSWLSASVAYVCGLLSFCSFASFAVVVVSFTFVISFSFSFVVSAFERISLSYRLVVSVVSFASLVIVVVAVAAVALSSLVFSFVL